MRADVASGKACRGADEDAPCLAAALLARPSPSGLAKAVYKDPRTGFGSIAQTLQQSRCATPASPEGR